MQLHNPLKYKSTIFALSVTKHMMYKSNILKHGSKYFITHLKISIFLRKNNLLTKTSFLYVRKNVQDLQMNLLYVDLTFHAVSIWTSDEEECRTHRDRRPLMINFNTGRVKVIGFSRQNILISPSRCRTNREVHMCPLICVIVTLSA